MLFYGNKQIEEWFIWLAAASTICIALVSMLIGEKISTVLLRSVVAFVVILTVCHAMLYVWRKISVGQSSKEKAQRAKFDILVGESIELDQLSATSEAPVTYPKQGVAGQINLDPTGMPDPQTQAKIIKKMGWGENDVQ